MSLEKPSYLILIKIFKSLACELLNMNEFYHHNKAKTVLWLKEPIQDLNIVIKLKNKDDISLLPKFEDISNSSSSGTLQQLECDKVEEFTFKWQQKVFSRYEVQQFGDVQNCVTDIEISYNDLINNFDYEPSKVFTYIHEDFYLPLPSDLKNKMDSNNGSLNLCSWFDKLDLGEKVGRVFGKDSSSRTHLFRSKENVDDEESSWTAMHIMLDNSEYSEDQLLLKQDAVLVSLYHCSANNSVMLCPGVNDLETNPYQVEFATGAHGQQYALELLNEDPNSGDDLLELLKELNKRWEQKYRHLMKFAMPPPGRRLVVLTLEVVTGRDFDMDNLYVDYHIKIPEEIECSDSLDGSTHVTKGVTADGTTVWNFGHLFELTLEAPVQLDSPRIQIFYEVISVDWWKRHRTEGYYYQVLILNPGRGTKLCRCRRPQELNSRQAESRRFFVGGCHLIQDLSVLAEPQTKKADFDFVTTGAIEVRWNIIRQAQGPGFRAQTPQYPGASTSSAAAVLQGAEAVLAHYRAARARLAAATKDLDIDKEIEDSGDG